MNGLTEIQKEAAAEARYVEALHAGFKGSREDYERIYRENLGKAVEEVKPKPIPPLTRDEIIRTRWRQAAAAGYMGTLHEYRQMFEKVSKAQSLGEEGSSSPTSTATSRSRTGPTLSAWRSSFSGHWTRSSKRPGCLSTFQKAPPSSPGRTTLRKTVREKSSSPRDSAGRPWAIRAFRSKAR